MMKAHHLFLASFFVVIPPALAQDKVVISEIDVWPEPGQIAFVDPSDGCRFTGAIDKGETISGLWSTSVEWRMTIDAKLCGDIRTIVSASVKPMPNSSVSSSPPMLRTGDQAILMIEETE